MKRVHPSKPDSSMPPFLPRISDYVLHWAQAKPESIAMVADGRPVSYGGLRESVDAIAKALIASGVGQGSRVAMLSPPCPGFLQVFIAAASVGAIWAGLNPRYSRRELAHPIRDCAPSLVIAQGQPGGGDPVADVRAAIAESGVAAECIEGPGGGGTAAWDSFIASGGQVPDDKLQARRSAVSPEDVCLIVYTSGTSGKPKGAMLTHHGLVYCSHTDARYNLDSDGQRILCNFPINHIACVGDVCATTLVVGGEIVFMDTFEPRGVLEHIQRYGITHLGQIPAMLQMELAVEDFADFDLGSLRQILWGGNPAPIDLVRRLRGVCPKLANLYGMTETTGNVLFVRGVEASDETLANTVGWAPPEYEVDVFAADEVPTGDGEVGEIHVRGAFLMKGYWQNDAATRAAFTGNGWFRTGDMAVRSADGTVSIVGRHSDMYKSGGYNIYPAEIEQVIEMHPGVEMAAVIGSPDPLYSEVGSAFVVAGNSSITPESLDKHCRKLLANYKIPKRFLIVREMPMLPNGKVDKSALKPLLREN